VEILARGVKVDVFVSSIAGVPSPHTFFGKILILLKLRRFDVKNGRKILRTKHLQSKILERKDLAREVSVADAL
jgi:hypothetical protein